MGNSLSCFDPMREHPPYSWPKNHPGRDEAIAELKRKRKNKKTVGSGGSADTVEKSSDVGATEAAKKAEEERLKKEEEAKKAEEEARLKAEEVKKAEEAAEAAKKAEEEAKKKVEEAKQEAEEAKRKAEEEANKAEEAAAAAAAAAAIAEAEKKVQEERVKPEDQATPEEAKRAEKKSSEAEEAGGPATKTEPATSPGKISARDAEKVRKRSSIDDRRAIFDRSEDVLPEAKDLPRDVHDPVTDEYITLAEYRRRQSERARGVVKERVEKYEGIDDKLSKEKSQLAAIEAARVEAQEKTDWKYKHDGEKVISPIIDP